MTVPKRGPLEAATRAQISGLGLKLRGKEAEALAASAIALAARADDLPDVPEFIAVRCDGGHDGERYFDAEVEGVGRCDAGLLAKLLGELRMTMIVLTAGRDSGDPLAAIAAELGKTSPGGPPMGHPER